MRFCSNIFSSKSYNITDVSVRYKKHIGRKNLRFQGCQGESYNSRSHAPIRRHTRSHYSRRIWRAHTKNNKLHEGVQLSHARGFSYVQAWSAVLFNQYRANSFQLKSSSQYFILYSVLIQVRFATSKRKLDI